MAIEKKVKDVKTTLSKERRLPGDKTKSTKKKTEDVSIDNKVGYFRGSWRELKRVTWPGRKEAWKMTFAVIAFTIIFSVFTTGLDFLIEKVVRQIFL